jgi:hypothetical protein
MIVDESAKMDSAVFQAVKMVCICRVSCKVGKGKSKVEHRTSVGHDPHHCGKLGVRRWHEAFIDDLPYNATSAATRRSGSVIQPEL